MTTASPLRATSAWTRIKALVIWMLVKIVLATLRIRVLYKERLDRARATDRPVLYAFWHGRQLALFKANPEDRLTVLASLSRDGEMQARICRRFGLDVVRGSSSRGGLTGMLMLARSLRRGQAVGIAVDGPRGPAYRAKPGIMALARSSGSPIVPITVGLRRRIELGRAWDRFQIPCLFTRITLAYGEPIQVPNDTSSSGFERLAELLTERLTHLTAEVDRRSHHPGQAQGPDQGPVVPRDKA